MNYMQLALYCASCTLHTVSMAIRQTLTPIHPYYMILSCKSAIRAYAAYALWDSYEIQIWENICHVRSSMENTMGMYILGIY